MGCLGQSGGCLSHTYNTSTDPRHKWSPASYAEFRKISKLSEDCPPPVLTEPRVKKKKATIITKYSVPKQRRLKLLLRLVTKCDNHQYSKHIDCQMTERTGKQQGKRMATMDLS